MNRNSKIFLTALILIVISMFPVETYAGKENKIIKLIEKGEFTKAVVIGGKYIKNNPEAPDLEIIKSLIMKADYELAKKANTVSSYEYFEKKYTVTPFYDDLMERKSIVFYNTVTVRDGKLEAYREFRKKFPDSSKSQEAYSKEIELAWLQAIEINTVEAYLEYRKKYPDSVYVKKALELEYELAWKISEKINTVKIWQAYQESYPNSPKIAEARNKEINAAWEIAVDENTSEVYEQFFINYPNSEQAKNAVPEEPSNLTILKIDRKKVTLFWEDNSLIEDSFKVERKSRKENYKIMSINPSDENQYNDQSVRVGETYTYRVLSCRNNKCSTPSNELIISLKAPDSPSNLKSDMGSDTMLQLSWEHNYFIGTRYEITKIDLKTKKRYVLNADTTSFTDMNVECGKAYSYSVSAKNPFGKSRQSNKITVKVNCGGYAATPDKSKQRPKTACPGKLKWGYSKSQVKRYYRSLSCAPTKNRETICGYSGGTFAGEETSLFAFAFYDYRLVYVIIIFIGDPSDELYDLLVSKYGDPDEENTYEAKWIIGDSTLFLSWDDDVRLTYAHTKKYNQFYNKRKIRAIEDL